MRNSIRLPVVFGGSGPIVFNVGSFTQSTGSEAVTNGDFALWTGDNPNNWTVNGTEDATNKVTENPAGQCQILNDNAAKFLGITQNCLGAAGTVNEISYDVKTVTVGSLRLSDAAVADFYTPVNVAGVHRQLYTARVGTNGNLTIYRQATITTVTIDDVSVKPLTLNPQQTGVADGTWYTEFTLPGSPLSGQQIQLRVRISGTSYLVGNITRNEANNAWQASLLSVNASAPTTAIAATTVSGIDAMAIVTSGQTVKLYTRASGIWTQVSTDQTIALNQTATGSVVIANTGITVTRHYESTVLTP